MDKLEKFVADITTAAGKLGAAQTHFEEEEKKLKKSVWLGVWSVLKPVLSSILLLLFILICIMKIPCGVSFEGAGITISHTCSRQS